MRRVLTILGVSSLLAGCYLGGDEATEAASVGPAPLRRLTNAQYINALHDLFPAVAVELPPLPNDTVVAGFDDAAEAQEPSDVRIARYETIANLYAAALTRDTPAVRALVGCDWATPTEGNACAASFIEQVGRRIYRRPVASDERERLLLRFAGWRTAIDFEAAVRLTLATMLQSPAFVYRPEPTVQGDVVAVAPYELASRLSLLLWQSTPDDELLNAAASGELSTADGLRKQATRMLDDAKAKRVLWDFTRQWLGLDRVLTDEHSFRAPEIDPAWTADTPLAAFAESRLFVENVGFGSLRDLLGSRRAWVNREMARLYGLPGDWDPLQFSEVALPEGERGGITTRIAFLAGTSHRGTTSPPIRGNAIELRLLCALPQSPPPNVDRSVPTTGQGPQTTRMLFEDKTSATTCQGCHAVLNGVGFGFEHYDAAGHFRTQENGLPIDATGKLLGTDVDRGYDGAMQMAAALSQSHRVHQCASQQWVRYALGRAPVDREAALVADLAKNLESPSGTVRDLLLQIVTAPTFRLRPAGGG